MAVIVDEPPYHVRYGGAVAAPVFKKIAESILTYMQIELEEPIEEEEIE